MKKYPTMTENDVPKRTSDNLRPNRVRIDALPLTKYLGWIPLTAIVFGSRTKRFVREDIARWGNDEGEGER